MLPLIMVMVRGLLPVPAHPPVTVTVTGLPEPKKLVLVEAGDHFFDGALDVLEREVASLT